MSFNGIHKLNPDWIENHKNDPPEKDYFGMILGIGIVSLLSLTIFAIFYLIPYMKEIEHSETKTYQNEIPVIPQAMHFWLFRMRR